MREEEAEVVFGGSFMELLGFAQNVATQNTEETKPNELEDQGFLLSPPYNNNSSFSCSSTSSSSSYPHMLHFGGGHEDFFLLNNNDASVLVAKEISRARSTKKIDGNGGGKGDTVVASVKPKAGSTTIKVRKEKVGNKISALQQLVSPFGKTDTASVLHEAIGYIRFLHDQVQVLSSAYLQQTSSSGILAYQGERVKELNEGDLRSRGLCLVPLSFTGNMTTTTNNNNNIILNGADLWSPAASMGGGGSSSSSSGSKH